MGIGGANGDGDDMSGADTLANGFGSGASSSGGRTPKHMPTPSALNKSASRSPTPGGGNSSFIGANSSFLGGPSRQPSRLTTAGGPSLNESRMSMQVPIGRGIKNAMGKNK